VVLSINSSTRLIKTLAKVQASTGTSPTTPATHNLKTVPIIVCPITRWSPVAVLAQLIAVPYRLDVLPVPLMAEQDVVVFQLRS
jgi:hypothetical protein